MADNEAERIAAEVAAARLRDVEEANKRAVLRQQAQPGSALSPGLIRGARNPADRLGERKPAGSRKIVDLPDDEPTAQAPGPERIKKDLKSDEMQKRIEAIKAGIRQDFKEWNAAKSFCKGELKKLGFSDESAESYAQDIVDEIFREQGNLQEDTAGSLPPAASYSENDYKRIIGRIVSFLRLDIQSGYGWEAICKGIDQSLDEDYPGIDKDRVKNEVFYHYQEDVKELEREQAAGTDYDWPPPRLPPPGGGGAGGGRGDADRGGPRGPQRGSTGSAGGGDAGAGGGWRGGTPGGGSGRRWPPTFEELVRIMQLNNLRINPQDKNTHLELADVLHGMYPRIRQIDARTVAHDFIMEFLRRLRWPPSDAQLLFISMENDIDVHDTADIYSRLPQILENKYELISPNEFEVVMIRFIKKISSGKIPVDDIEYLNEIGHSGEDEELRRIQRRVDAGEITPEEAETEKMKMRMKYAKRDVKRTRKKAHADAARKAFEHENPRLAKTYYGAKEESKFQWEQRKSRPGFIVGGRTKLAGALSVPKYGLAGPERAAMIGGRMRLIVFKSRNMLSKRARVIYTTKLGRLKSEIKDVNARAETAKNNLEEVNREINKHFAKESGSMFGNLEKEENAQGAVDALRKTNDKDSFILAEQLRQAYAELKDAKEKVEKYKNIESLAYEIFEEEIKGEKDRIVNTMKMRYSLDEKDMQTLQGFMDNEASYFTQYYSKMAASSIRIPTKWLRGTAFATQSLGEGVNSIFSSLWNLLTGPWTIGAIMILIMGYFITVFVEYNPFLLVVMPLLGGGFFWLMNATETKTPLDMFAHFEAGVIAMFEVVLFMYLLGLNEVLAA